MFGAAFNLIRLFLLFSALAPLALFSKNRAIYLFLRSAGPSFLKLGQIASSRPDVVGVGLASLLSSFQDRAKAFFVAKIVQEEFGNSFSKEFLEFDFCPSASASIAQVHKAKIANGEFVAVKILRPKIQIHMARDIASLRFLAFMIRRIFPFLSKFFQDIAALLEGVSRTELDLLLEAANASKLREDMKSVDGFYVPKVHWNLSSSRILVLEWIDGIPFSNEEALLKSHFDKKKIAENLVISYFNQVYVAGFFHADMHPGNLFLMKNGNIAVVDFGIMGNIDKRTRLAIAEILIGFLEKNYLRVAEIHIEAGLVPKETNVFNLALSCRKIGETIVGSDVKDISVAKLLSNLIAMTRDYKMQARPELLLLQKTILLVEGVGVRLDPNLNIWNLARPWVKDWAKKNIGFDAKIRDALLNLISLGKNFLRNF